MSRGFISIMTPKVHQEMLILVTFAFKNAKG